jgi:exonuclease SbcC
MKLTIESLTLVNFKGIKFLEITEFSEVLNIRGKNESGKTTIMDAFIYLFFNKNSEDKADFSIKTINKETGKPESHLDHEVRALVNVDGKKWDFHKIYRETWERRKGNLEAEFTGHETLYFINTVPMKLKEYKAKVDELIPEQLFKLLTNPAYFNTLKWEAKREILFKMVDEVSDQDVFDQFVEYQDLKEIIGDNSIAEHKSSLSYKISELKKSKEHIPARIDEANRNMPEAPDVEAIETAIGKLNLQIAEVEISIMDSLSGFNKENEENQAIMQKVFQLQSKMKKTEHEFELLNSKGQNETAIQRQGIINTIARIKADLQEEKSKEKLLQGIQTALDKEISDLRKSWTEVNESIMPEMDSKNFSCPMCKRPYEESDINAKIEEFTTNWKQNKVNQLESINTKGLSLAAKIKENKNQLAQVIESIKTISELLSSKESELALIPESNKTAISLSKEQADEIEKIDAEIKLYQKKVKTVVKPNTSDMEQKKKDFLLLMDKEKAKLSSIEIIESTKKRMNELRESEKIISIQIAQLEKIQFDISRFEKSKADITESRVNELFKYVKFRMFNVLINGGLDPCCETLYKGVPWPDLNTAGKMWAGLDIINTLSNFYNTYVPCFLDNRESSTNIPEMNSQVINLIVDPQCENLTFNN